MNEGLGPTTYLVDTGVVLGFQKAGHLDALADAGHGISLVLVEEVYDEVTDPRNDKHAVAARDAKRLIDASKVRVCSISLGSPAAATHSSIRAGKKSATADLGESASIAFAVHNAGFTFVTNDAAASLRGLQGLRGRTLSFHPFLALLVESGALLRHRSEAIAIAIRKLSDWRAIQPVWWDDWVMRQHSGR
jgi:hypothetical protein